jgi:bifunctional NMN adenylyltransferase/nudix hydrolase
MQPVTPDATIGVIIGRFQVQELTEGHRALIDTVCRNHKKVLILLGYTPGVFGTRNNPLDFQTRRLMIHDIYPHIEVHAVRDLADDTEWSRAVDDRIGEIFEMGSKVIYGSRDSFIPHYNGRNKTVELDSTVPISGTKVRREASEEVKQSPDFRRGVIYAAHGKFPVAFPTVDAAIIRKDGKDREILMARKGTDPAGQWRFIGGFVDPVHDDTKEDTVRREVSEEAGVETDWPVYIGSHKVSDWRYRGEPDSIMTSLYLAPYLHGPATAGDDIDEVEWFRYDDFIKGKGGRVIEDHAPLLKMLDAHLRKEQT